MNTSNRHLHDFSSRRLLCWWTDQVVPSLAVVLLLASVLALTGCDNLTGSSEESASTAVTSTNLSAAVSDVANAADLDADQINSIREAAARYEGEPGGSWYLAADLHEQLSQEQIDRLITRMKERREQLHQRFERHREEGGEGQPRRRFNHRRGGGDFRADLNLSDGQKEEIQAIRAEYGGEMRELFESLRAGSAPEEDRERLRELREQMREEMQAVLTDDQRQQLEEHREETIEERREHHEAVRAAMAEALELTDEQREQLRSLWSERLEETEGSRRMGPRPFRGRDLREQISSILTEKHKEIMALHDMLSLRARHGHEGGEGTQYGR